MSLPDRATLSIELGGRVALASLAAAYFLAVPAASMPVQAAAVVGGLAVYVVAHVALFLRARAPRAGGWITPLASLLDGVAAVAALASDPATVPPTALLLLAVALNASLRAGWSTLLATLAGTGLAIVAAVMLREQLYSEAADAPFAYLLAFIMTTLVYLAIQTRRQGFLQDHARRFAGQDAETQLLNRRGFDDAAGYLVPLHQRTQLPLVIMLASLDTRDTRPLDAGTLAACVRQVGHVVRQRARRSDVVARLSEDEFVFMLFDTPLAGGESLARALLERFGAWTRQQGIDARLTFGMVNTPDEPVAIDQLIARARSAVQRAQKHPSAPSVVTAPSL